MEVCCVAERTSGTDADRVLGRRLARGDAFAVDAFYREHRDAIYRFVYYRLGRVVQDAEDVTADTFLTALRSAGEYGGRAPLAVWLRGIARNKCRDKQKSGARRRRLLDQRVGDVVAGAIERIDRAEIPPDVLAARETSELVDAALSQLPPHYQKALRSKYVDELTFAEIGEASSTSAKAAESLVQRAKVAFAKLLKALGQTGGRHG
jgi:RNA polymerase sigma factor (sigma-70 family)